MSGGGNRSSGSNRPRTPTTGGSGANPLSSMPGYSSNSSLNPSWAGGSTPSTFEPKDFGTNLFSDMNRIYKQGPQVFNKALFTPYGQATSGLIQQGLGDVQAGREGVLGDVASGDWMDRENPYFENALRRTRDNIGTDVNATFNANGLWGSDLHAKGLAEGMGNVENDARLANFENEYSRMMGARGALQSDIATGLGYGGLLDSKAQEQLMADYDLFNRQKDAPFQHIAKNIGVLTGNPQAVDDSTNQAAGPMDWLGTAAQVAGATLPWLLPMLSDERAKKDIEPVGKTPGGNKVVSYRYKGEGGPKRTGVLAQDVMKRQPEAVGRHPSGLFMVDYAKVR